jgi:hypothetical protein
MNCTSKPREDDVQIVHADSMARMIKCNAKKDNGDVFFGAMLKHYDETTQEFYVDALATKMHKSK